jgi:hypothetical protein
MRLPTRPILAASLAFAAAFMTFMTFLLYSTAGASAASAASAAVGASDKTTDTGEEPWRARDLNPVTFHDAPAHDPVPLVEDGRAVATLCLPAKPSAAVEAAVRELRSCVKEATGAELPV